MNLGRTAESADVALLLEGTYPFVSGGVSSWVQQIIKSFPDIRYAVYFVGSMKKDYGKQRYPFPDNVVHAEAHYLYEREDAPIIDPVPGDAELFGMVEQMHEYFRAPKAHAKNAHLLGTLSAKLHTELSYDQFLYSEQAWKFVREHYRKYCTDPSFVDYFWTVRTMHSPIWVLSRVCNGMIPVRAFHTVSTGYAGFLGALAKRKYNKPYIISEHGIYTKERKIDLFAAQWISDNRSVFQRDPTESSYFRQLWIKFFEALGRAAYDASDSITALYETNRLRQVADGADEKKTQSIPNGIDIAAYKPLRALRPATPPPVMCLIGRVVPIKDVKTFVRAMRTVVNRMPEAEAWIAGPEDEDPSYAKECHSLVEGLGLQDKVKFLGFQKLTDVLPKIGLVVLSSISEALPLVILEGYAAGVPTVSTDVGSCRQIIYGNGPEDEALGPSGRVVGIADPQALATAALELLTDADAWNAAAQAGIQRVERYYSLEMMIGLYRKVYDHVFALEANGG